MHTITTQADVVSALGEPLAVTPQSVRQVIAVLEAAQRSSDEGNVPITLG